MFSRFFINRPIFASVLSIVIVLAGTIAGFTLPVAQYPEIAPPTVEVSASYPGANCKTVADTVAAPIEQQVNGVENMIYMSSQSTNDGNYTLTITFKNGTDLNIAQVLVQQRVSLAEPVLPILVQRRGISVKKKSPNVLMIVNLFATDESGGISQDRDSLSLYLSNYATIQIRDELSRIPGVGDVTYLGQRDYSMRVWLDPEALSSRGLNPQDVINAVNAQNIQVAAGQIGQPPVPSGQVFQYIMTTKGRLSSKEDFERIVIKNSPDGSLVYLKEVAWIELGAQSYDQSCTLDGKPSVALSIYQSPGSNALDVANRVKQRMKELKEHFSPGISYAIVYDTTPFIRESIFEVFETLFDAIVLVAIVVLVFLQNWRSSLIPLIAVPVAVVGTFAVMAAMGFSLNNLTLFGLVLAIGIVVDDAIVVVEAVEHHIEHGMAPREATLRAMEMVSGPVIAIGLVLAAVFVPCAFIGGIIGQFFRQFALTIAVSTIISAFNSLTLSPALSALLLRPRVKGVFEALPWFIFTPLGAWMGHKLGQHGLESLTVYLSEKVAALLHLDIPHNVLDILKVWAPIVMGGLIATFIGVFLARPANAILGGFFRLFNRAFDLSTSAYTRTVSGLLRVSLIVVVVYGGLLVLTWWGFAHMPTGFIPAQDKGYLLVNVQLPDGASTGRTEEVVHAIETVARNTPGIKHTVAISGQSILLNANAPNFGALYLMLDDFEHRTAADLSSDAIARTLDDRLQHLWQLPPRSLDTLRAQGVPEAVLARLDDSVIATKFVGIKTDFSKELAAVLGDSEAERYRDLVMGALTRYDLNAKVNTFGAPPVEGLGTAGGFKIIVQDRGDSGLPVLQQRADEVVNEARKDPNLQGLFTSFRADTPWLELVVNREQAKNRNVSIDDLRSSLESTLGPYYVNDFNLFGRTWQVNIQSREVFRGNEDDIKKIRVRNSQGGLVPLGDFADVRFVPGPVLVMRYNLYPSAAVNADAAPGTSSGEVIDRLGEAAKAQLPVQMRAEWSELAYLQLQTGSTAMWVFVLAVVLVFLVLAAQYESWALPLGVILVVPMCLLCSIAGVAFARMDVNIFTQIGFLVLVGLACKNAILIVEYAKAQREAGVPRYQATLEACKLRLRPIIMTSFAFILGVVPLVLSEGAGAEMRRTLGTAVFSGMLGVTLFGIFLTPVFYYVIQWFKDRREPKPTTPAPHESHAPPTRLPDDPAGPSTAIVTGH